MDHKARRTLADLALATLTIAGAVLLLFGAMSLPPPRFEPLGSAALPRILASLLIVFAAIVAVGAILRHRASAPAPALSAADIAAAPDPWRGAMVLAALVAYVFAMDVLRVPFIAATPLFVIATGLAIGARSWRGVVAFAVLGLVLAVGISTVLERFLYVRIG